MSFASFANDCFHILNAPSGSKLALFGGLVSNGRTMGFRVQHPQAGTEHYLFREIFARQHYFFRTDSAAPLILDCGANVGMATVYFKWLYPNSRVNCFEADPATFAMLQENIHANATLSGVTPYNFALWDQNGSVDFFINAAIPGSLLMSTDPAHAQEGQKAIRVPSRRLSEFIAEPIDFLKLDVEGAEHRVICDLFESGKISMIRQMAIEYHHRIGTQKCRLGDFLGILERAGFEYKIDAAAYPPNGTIYQNILIVANHLSHSRITK